MKRKEHPSSFLRKFFSGVVISATLQVVSDGTPPVISDISLNPTQTTVTINWITDEEADSQVRVFREIEGVYEEVHYENHEGFKTHHSVVLRGLRRGQEYLYEITSADRLGNRCEAESALFNTLNAPLLRASPAEEEVWRLNCGWTEGNYVDPDGNLWAHDESFKPIFRWGFYDGTAARTEHSISGTDLEVYRSHSWGADNMSYRIEVPDGDYEVTLMFAETYYGESGARVFDVAINSETVLANYDIYATVGKYAADSYTFPATPVDKEINVSFPKVTAGSALISGIVVRPLSLTDEAFLDFIQKKMFWFFWNETNPDTGIVIDDENNWQKGYSTFGGLAATGFGMSILTVGAERGWVSRDLAAERVEATLDTFEFSGDNLTAENSLVGHLRGFWYHFIDAETFEREGTSEVSTVDSALFIMGALQAGEYFRETHPQIKVKAEALFRRMEWDWWQGWGSDPKAKFINMGWRPTEFEGTVEPNTDPEGGFFIDSWWAWYNESVFVILMALASDGYSVDSSLWMEMDRNWRDVDGFHMMYASSLFTHHYQNVYFDLRKQHDRFANYFDNAVYATLHNRLVCLNDSEGRYEPKRWGLSASLSPEGPGVDYGPDDHDGTVAPSACLTSLPLTPMESIEAARYMFFQYKHDIWGRLGYTNSFNVQKGFRAELSIGLNNGSSILSIENYRSGMIWRTFMESPYVQAGLAAAGFIGYDVSPLYQCSSVEPGGIHWPQNAFDGDMGTRWASSHSDSEWLSVDFGESRPLKSVTIDWEAAYGRSYEIQGSNNGYDWTLIHGEINGDGGQDVLTFPTAHVRYVRLYGIQRGTSYGYSIYEMSFGFDDPPVYSASSSDNASREPRYAFDLDRGTRWASEWSDPQWIAVDYQTPRSMSRVVIDWEYAYADSYAVEVSNNGIDWSEVYSTTEGDGGIDLAQFPPVQARHLRLLGKNRATPYGYSVHEISVD